MVVADIWRAKAKRQRRGKRFKWKGLPAGRKINHGWTQMNMDVELQRRGEEF
jgi:hypothetical protein